MAEGKERVTFSEGEGLWLKARRGLRLRARVCG